MKKGSQEILTPFVLLLILLGVFLVFSQIYSSSSPQNTGLKSFSSKEELLSYMKNSSYNSYRAIYEAGDLSTTRITSSPAGSAEISGKAEEYSTTNIQVEGVDEADIVKNDGKFIYTVSYNSISIIKAYPPEDMKLASNIKLDGYIKEIFLNENKLVVFGEEKYDYAYPIEQNKIASGIYREMPLYYYSPKSFIRIYDVSDREKPEMVKKIVFDGYYHDSRMIGNYVYVITNQPFQYLDGDIVLPKIEDGVTKTSIQPQDIYYFDMPYLPERLTTIFSIDLSKMEMGKKSYLTGYTQTIFVSNDNIYLTSQKEIPFYEYQLKLIEKAILPFVDASTSQKIREVLDSNLGLYEKQEQIQNLFLDYFNTLPESEKDSLQKKIGEKNREIELELQKEMEKTIIHKISISGGKIEYKGRGEAPGYPLNQFSMDEYEGYFRIATTTGNIWDDSSKNHLYVLDQKLNIVGRLEDLAPGEKIYSVRFMGERAYMVTFKKVDPLFVIDLSSPEKPKVLGKLKIPGYSDYLHPYDENHIIGIGKEAVDASEEETSWRGIDFAWYQGVKLSLFDVTDVEHPKEISKFIIGDRGTDSEALYDHKAFLFDKRKGLLVMPILLAEIDEKKYPEGVKPTTYGDYVWQGAYVFDVSLDKGFSLKGKVSHDDQDSLDKSGYYYSSPYSVRRSLYMDDVLYTVSEKMVKANGLDNLQEIQKVELPFSENYPMRYW